MKVSLILASFRRPHLLDFTLRSIESQEFNYDFEVVVVNDGVEDETQDVCRRHDSLNIKYVFSGQRNHAGDFYRVAGFANNIGVKQSTGDIIVMSCAEVMHLNQTLNFIVKPLLKQKKFITTPRFMFFDDSGDYTRWVAQKFYLEYNGLWHKYFQDKPMDLPWFGSKGLHAVKMPYLMGMWKHEYTGIGGYDEDFTGNACDDNDFTDRLIANGCIYHYTEAQIVHLYHGKTSDAKTHYDDPKWVYNYNLYQERKHVVIRNEGREWGVIDQEHKIEEQTETIQPDA